jgi:hypothetical protein
VSGLKRNASSGVGMASEFSCAGKLPMNWNAFHGLDGSSCAEGLSMCVNTAHRMRERSLWAGKFLHREACHVLEGPSWTGTRVMRGKALSTSGSPSVASEF